MQLRPSIALLLPSVALAAAPAAAQERGAGAGEVSSRTAIYSDNDETTVVTSAVDGEVVAPGDVAVGAHALIDAVSTASIDVVSAATGRWSENRVELGARAGIDLDRVTGLSLGYTNSRENDWHSHTLQLTARRELANRNTRITAGYAAVLNQVGRAGDPAFERDLDIHSGQLAVSQLWSERTLVSLTYNVQRAAGYQASPYRFVELADGSMLPESHPEVRWRHALTGRHLRAIADAFAVDSSYRFYADDWGLRSHTATSALRWRATGWLDLRARMRGYYQRGAHFYADGYAQPRRFMTADRELSQLWNAGAGLKAVFYLGRFTLDAKVDAVHYEFLEFSRLPYRDAVISGLGARMSW